METKAGAVCWYCNTVHSVFWTDKKVHEAGSKCIQNENDNFNGFKAKGALEP